MLRDVWIRLRALLRREKVEAELDEELRFHIERQAEKYIQFGMGPEDARRRARIELGGVEQTKEECRDARGINFIETTIRDVRYGLRQLRRSPGFTVVAILTLALGIGANTALFSVVNGALLNPLPYRQPDRLVAIYSRTRQFQRASISYPNYLDWLRDNRSFSAIAAYRENYDYNLTGVGEPEPVRVEMVSASFFPLLGVKPVAGRLFRPDEDRLGASPVVLLSEGFWKRKFGGSPQAVGKTATLNGTQYRIVGVIPADFRYESGNFHASDVYLPIGQWSNSSFRDRRVGEGMDAVGRLKPGVTIAQAQADMDVVAEHLSEQYPEADKDKGITLVSLQQDVVRRVRSFLLILLAAVGFVLLIACANVANLLLARSTGRAREFAIRTALGATPGRVVGQLLTESILLAGVGGGLGLLLATWGTRAGLAALPEALPRTAQVHIDGRVLLFTLAISVLAGILFGLAPALRTFHVDSHETLKEGGRGSSGTRHRTQRVLVVVEMAMAVILLVGAGLTIRSLAKLWQVNPGFDTSHVLTFGVSPPSWRGKAPEVLRRDLRQLNQKLESIPGIEAASLVAGALPMQGDSEIPFWLEGQAKPATQSEMKMTLFYGVQPDYLKVMQIPLERGRFLRPDDDENSAPVVVIDTRFAQIYFGNRNPIGQRVNLGIINTSPEIVGVVGHVKQWGLDSGANAPIQAQMYMPTAQIPDEAMPEAANGIMAAVRTRGSPSASVAAIRGGLAQFDSQMAMFSPKPMRQVVSDSLASRRFSMMLLGGFAALALLLASIGIYGVIAYDVSQRLHEMGVRVALGAGRRDILRLVLVQGFRLILLGLAIGLVGAVALSRFLSSMLYGVTSTDPLTYGVISLVLVAVALAACYVPARRAMRIDPAIALRHE